VLATAGTSIFPATSVWLLSTALSDAWGSGSAVPAAVRGSVAAAVLAGALGTADSMWLPVVCTAAALVSGSIFASFSASAELATGV